LTKNIEIKRAELIQFIKTVGAPHIWSTYNFYLKEIGCPDLIPDGSKDPVLDRNIITSCSIKHSNN